MYGNGKTANSSISTTPLRFSDVPARNAFEYLQKCKLPFATPLYSGVKEEWSEIWEMWPLCPMIELIATTTLKALDYSYSDYRISSNFVMSHTQLRHNYANFTVLEFI